MEWKLAFYRCKIGEIEAQRSGILSTLLTPAWGASSGACCVRLGKPEEDSEQAQCGTCRLLGLLTASITLLSQTTPASITMKKISDPFGTQIHIFESRRTWGFASVLFAHLLECLSCTLPKAPPKCIQFSLLTLLCKATHNVPVTQVLVWGYS